MTTEKFSDFLSSQTFSESAFLAGNGTDLQPLLRLNHLLESLPVPDAKGIIASTFISATVGTPHNLESLTAAIKIKLETLADLENGCLEIVGEPRELMRPNIGTEALNGQDNLLSFAERNAYIEQLIQPNQGKLWAAEIIFERGKGTGRFIRFIHIGDEALATLSALSKQGEFTPKIIVTVQTGLLEEPNGPLARMIANFKKKPQIWLRGRWLNRDYKIRSLEFERLGTGTYSHVVQKFPYWNGTLGHPDEMPAKVERIQTQSIVRAFQTAPLIGLRDKVELINGVCTIRLIKETLEPKNDGRTTVVSKVVKNKWLKAGHDVSNVLVWEDLSRTSRGHALQPFTLNQALSVLEVNHLKKKHYAILPVGFEDEGFRVLEFLSLGRNVEIDIHFENSLDFYDLRRT